MKPKDPKNIIITLKNGLQFTHKEKGTEDEFWELVQGIIDNFGKTRSATLVTYYPFSIYRFDDISSIHFENEKPPKETIPMGLHPQKTKK